MEGSIAQWAEKNRVIALITVFFLFAAMVYFVARYKMADDLSFDFAGYSQRYHFAFSGWVKNLLGGVPADVFVPTLPSVLPLALRALGFGTFTLPLALSELIFRIFFAFSFVLIARHFRVPWTIGAVAGLLLVLNPITYNFLDRYYELASWVFFTVSFLFMFKLVEEKDFSGKYFLGAAIFAALSILSSSVGAFFLGIASIFLITSRRDLKRIFFAWIFSIGLSVYWLFPFAAYYGLSIISRFEGHVLRTPGTFYSSVFLVALLGACFLFFYRKIFSERRLFQLLSLTFLLALVQFFFPLAPVIGKPFTHSYHIFYLAILSFCFIGVAGKIRVPKKLFAGAVIVLFLVAFAAGPEIAKRYTSRAVNFSDYDLNGQKINFSEIDYFLKQIPHTARYEVVPHDPVISAYSSVHYDLTNLFGWGFNGVSLTGFEDMGLDFSETGLNCADALRAEKLLGLSHVISLSKKTSETLSQCNFKKAGELSQATLFVSPNYSGESLIVENARLLEYSNTRISILANPPSAVLKVNYFPRWKAYSSGAEIPIIDKKPGMQVGTEKEEIVEFRYEWTPVEIAGLIVSVLSTICMAVFVLQNLKNHEKTSS